mmetsp:Transcript_60385/g.160877  ORF Transcript_60385/g.160877 Transcript_60385/m.160877 type:complete len:90 (-) Transcript_60385:581-850(-)
MAMANDREEGGTRNISRVKFGLSKSNRPRPFRTDAHKRMPLFMQLSVSRRAGGRDRQQQGNFHDFLDIIRVPGIPQFGVLGPGRSAMYF